METIFTGMVAMPQPTIQYVQLGQTPNMAHPVIQYNGKLTFIKVIFNQIKYRVEFLNFFTVVKIMQFF